MTTSYYGIKTTAKDGFEYNSKFEAEFVNKFLIPHNIAYERQKQYSTESKHRCDFYLPDYDVWVECVYNTYVPKKEYTFGKHDLTLSIPWADARARNVAKSAGAKWDRVSKKWILHKSLIDPNGNPTLEKYMNPKLLETRYDSDQISLTKTYNLNLKNKLLLYADTYTIIQVNNEDLKKHHISEIIRVKNNPLFLKLLTEQPHLVLIKEPKPVINEDPAKEAPSNLVPGSAIVGEDGSVTYVSKRKEKENSRALAKEKRFTTFKKLVHGSTKEEIRKFHRILTKMLDYEDWKAEVKGKEFPDK